MATWIWNFGDFAIRQHLLLSTRREERGSDYPPVWPVADCCKSVVFLREAELAKPETVTVFIDGKGRVELDGKAVLPDMPFPVSAGKHTLAVKVINPDGLPSIYVEGNAFASGDGWKCSAVDNTFYDVGYWNLDDKHVPPSKFSLPVKPISPVSVEKTGAGYFVDFGKETFIKLKLSGVTKGKISVCYGESAEEAIDIQNAPVSQVFYAEEAEYTLPARACRYVNLTTDCTIEKITGLYEYLPLENKGSFRCDNPSINRIYDTAVYTLELTAREMFVDGIKRDRWVWSGDAYQSYLMNYYTFFDTEINKRTILALRGSDPVTRHLNTILDYSFYWIISIGDYYQYTGDTKFLRQVYGKMVTLMDYCLSRRSDEGLAAGLPGDWVFIDWADMEKDGALCAEQILLCEALRVMAQVAELIGEDAAFYQREYTILKEKILELYWKPDLGGFVTTYHNGKKSTEIRRHANIFAILFGIADQDMAETILHKVLLNDAVPQITTPYFKFYELEALCRMGHFQPVTEMLQSYWGGMLELGATTFWEEYDPTLSGAEHYAMYGHPYDKSLCHAWGASPVYLLGRYYLGVSPGEDGFIAKPCLGGLKEMHGTVPLKGGSVRISMDKKGVTMQAEGVSGTLLLSGKAYPVQPGREYYFERG